MYRLVFLNGKDKGRRVVVRDATATVGRNENCRVCVDDTQALDRHAVLEEREDGVYVRATEQSLLSVNDAVLQSTRLDHDDIIRVGETEIQYQFVTESPFYETRRLSLLNLLSIIAVVAILLAQAAVVGRLIMGVWLLEDEAKAAPASEAPARPVRSPDETQAELVAARERMDRLTAESEQQSTEELWAGGEATRLAQERERLGASIEKLEGELAQWEAEAQAGSETAPLAPPSPSALERANTLLQTARSLVVEEQVDEALERLAEAKRVAPSFLPPRIMAARLLEQRNDFSRAVQEWDELLRVASDPALLEELTAARSNAARLAALARSDATPGTGRPIVDRDALPQQLRIGSMRRSRLPQRDGFDEVRMVRFEVSIDPDAGPVRAEGVHFDVRFVDRVVGGEEVFLSRVPVSTQNLTATPPWPADEEREFSVLYMVPEGFRERDADERGANMQFYGFLIRAYYDGILQDVKAFPSSLLVRPDAAHVRP